MSQLIICAKSVDENLETSEEILSVVTMHGHVRGENLYDAVQKNVLDLFDKSKLSAVCTDGAKVMVGKKKGLVGLLLKNDINVPFFHCIIHQQSLFSKELGMSYVMEIAIKIVNRIRGGHKALTHRKFKTYLEEVESNYGDLLLYTEVRWLSRGRCLERFFNLRGEILAFLEADASKADEEFILALKNIDFNLDLAFLCDLTSLLNELNLNLQGKNKHIFDLVSTVNHFGRKLKILINDLRTCNFCNLPKTAEIFLVHQNSEKINQYIEIIERLYENYEKRFEDFDTIKKEIELHDNPLECNISEQNIELQDELRTMREDFAIPLAIGKQFWKQISDEKYPKIKSEIYKLYSMFGSTYNCESSFSFLKIILSKARNRISDDHISDLIRIKMYDGEIDIQNVMQFQNKQTK